MTTDEFENIVKDWFATARHPKLTRPYDTLTYQPMVELLAYLRGNGFKTFIVSGGGIEFMRTFAETAYGIPPNRSSAAQASRNTRYGKASPFSSSSPS